MFDLQKLSITLAGATLIAFAPVALAEPVSFSYSITDLGTLVPTDINDKGQVVGVGDGRALLYSNGRIIEISKLRSDDDSITPSAINNKGQVVGNSTNIGVSSRVFHYSNGTTQDIGIDGVADGINNKGQITGVSNDNAFLYSDGTTTIINSNAIAYDINDKSQVVGSAGNPHSAFLYDRGTIRKLGTLSPYDSSSASAINDRGHIVGSLSYSAFPPIYDSSAFFYTNSRGIINLGRLLSTDIFSNAADINNKDQVVGSSSSFSGSRAFFYDGRLQDLNTLIPPNSGVTLNSANAINDSGQIVGTGIINGQQHGFLLTPTK